MSTPSSPPSHPVPFPVGVGYESPGSSQDFVAVFDGKNIKKIIASHCKVPLHSPTFQLKSKPQRYLSSKSQFEKECEGSHEYSYISLSSSSLKFLKPSGWTLKVYPRQ